MTAVIYARYSTDSQREESIGIISSLYTIGINLSWKIHMREQYYYSVEYYFYR